MSFNSINTNVGAMIALQSLNAINRDLSDTLRHISTGLAISSPKDNAAVWAIAQNQRAESKSLDAVRASLQRGQSITDVALAAGETVTDLLGQMKEKMLAASDTSLSTASRKALNDDYLNLKRQIDRTVGAADFNGINLISSGSTGQIRALANADASDTVDVDHVDLSTTGSALSGMRADLLGAPISAAEIKAMGGRSRT
jgi:flagellin